MAHTCHKTNDSSGVQGCLRSEDSSDSWKNDGKDQQRSDTNLMQFSDDENSEATSFKTGSSSGSGSKPGYGAESKPCVYSSDAGAAGKLSADREKSKGVCGSPLKNSKPLKPLAASSSPKTGGSVEKTSGKGGDNMWSGSSGPSSRTRDTPTWTLRKAWDCHVELGPLYFTADHTVLINVTDFSQNQTLKSVDGRPQWDGFHVKMPNAQENIIMKSSFFSGPEKQVRWSVISKQLEKLKSGSPTVDNVKKAINAYNPKYEHTWSFAGLKNYVQTIPKQESIFSTVIPKMAALALKLPEYVPRAVPLLKEGKTHAITLSQLQIAALLANAFFCTFPRRNSTDRNAEYANYPTINFNSLFGNSSQTTVEKLRAILHYFNTVTDHRHSRLVTFERCCIPDSRLPNWRERTEPLGNVCVTSEGSIEEQGEGMLQVDFACNLVGGGVLGSGLVQEEILFLMNPELIVARLFTEKLSDNECLKITGSQKYSTYSGYSRSFEWRGPHDDLLMGKKDKWKRIQRQIVAIDALNFRHPREQYQKNKIKRELNKLLSR